MRSIRGLSIDRFFRYEHGAWPSTLKRWHDEGLPREVGGTVSFAEYFEMDPVNRIDINSGYTHTPYEPVFEKRIIEEAGGTVLFEDTDGILKREKRSERDTSMPQFIRFPVACWEDWEKVRRRLAPEGAKARIGDVAALAEKEDERILSILPLCGVYGQPRNLLGEEGLAFVIYDDPNLLIEMIANWLELYTELLSELTKTARVDCLLIWEDMCYRNGPLISPEHFRKFMLPAYKQLIGAARSFGIEAVIVDSDGDVSKMPSELSAALTKNHLTPQPLISPPGMFRLQRKTQGYPIS